MTWARLETAAVARALASVAAEAGDLAEVYFERRIDAEWPPAEARCGLRVRREEGLAARLVRGERSWLASRDRITGAHLLEALRQVARAQPATLLEPDIAVGTPTAIPFAALRSFAAELERAIRRHHVAFPLQLTVRWHRRDVQVVGPRWVPSTEREVFFSLEVDMPWGRFGALATDLAAGEAERVARSLVGRFMAREAEPPHSGRFPVLLAPAATAVLLHEAVAHALEADLMGEIGGMDDDWRRSIGAVSSSASPGFPLDVLDDPRRAPRGVDRTTDDEGQAVVRRWLIRAGKVDQVISDSMCAARSATHLAGSGFRGGRHQPPLPRTHHLELLPGDADPRRLQSAAEGGLYVPELDRGRLDPATGEVVLHAPCGRYLLHGEPGDACGPFELRAFVPDLLASVVAVGKDAQAAGAGWCAKAGQRRAVWATAPSVVIADIAVFAGTR
ncbi:MAG: metallopeptidase TldD-related protein [Thermoanaerobaculia bacterium]